MENSKSSSNIRNMVYNGKQSLLPPKIPFPGIISPSYNDYIPNNPTIGSRVIQKPIERNPPHQRTSSESLVIEEQPSWLDDLLNEPETPVRKGGHRRSSSDSSFAYDTNIDYSPQNLVSAPSWGSQELGLYRDQKNASMFRDSIGVAKMNNRSWDPSLNSMAYLSGLPSVRDRGALQNSGMPCPARETDGNSVPSTTTEKANQADSGLTDPKVSSEQKDGISTKPPALETDAKRAKQQFAQRSRVRKLQYIAELERNVQALQAEWSEASAELEFMNQQNLILSMENKSMKQRLESLTQEQLIKCMEQEILEREIGRLRTVYQLQLQQPNKQPLTNSHHRRTRSHDLNSQFSDLSLKSPQEQQPGSSRDSVRGPLRI